MTASNEKQPVPAETIGIKRYGYFRSTTSVDETRNGEYVLFNDHLAEVEKLRQALRKYGIHELNCPAVTYDVEPSQSDTILTMTVTTTLTSEPCTCGLAAILEEGK